MSYFSVLLDELPPTTQNEYALYVQGLFSGPFMVFAELTRSPESEHRSNTPARGAHHIFFSFLFLSFFVFVFVFFSLFSFLCFFLLT